MQIIHSNSRQETVGFAEKFAQKLPKGAVIAFLGDLGAGKTAFVTGLAKGLSIDCDVSSPTFAICNQYIGDENTLYHFDMYRVDGWDDLYSTGFSIASIPIRTSQLNGLKTFTVLCLMTQL